MADKSTEELKQLLVEKDKLQDDAIVAVIEELKAKDHTNLGLDEKLPLSFKLKDDPEYLLNKLRHFDYIVHSARADEVIIELKKIVGSNIYRFTQEKIEIEKKTLFKKDKIEVRRSQVKDFVIQIDPYETVSLSHENSWTKYPLRISPELVNGQSYKIIDVSCLQSDLNEVRDYLNKIIKIFKMGV